MRLKAVYWAVLAALITGGCGTNAPLAPVRSAGNLEAEKTLPPNLISDGSFENPVVPGGSFTLFSNGQSIGKWTVTGAAGNVAIVSGSFSQDGFTFDAKCGKQWLDLTGVSNSATGVEQTIHPASGSHELSFALGAIYDPNGIFGTTSTVNVFINGGKVATKSETAVASDGVTQTWKFFKIPVTVNSSSTQVTFINGDPSNVTNDALDCVAFR